MHDRTGRERLAFRFASSEDIDRYYGARPGQTLQAVVILMGDQPVAVIGVARQIDHAQFFSEYRETYRPHLNSMVTLRALKQAMLIVSKCLLPVYALAEKTEPDSVRLLGRLGFTHVEENLYRWQP